ncbi:hypothetical protein ACFL35_17440 [Candidatus Riflebacteria bacterium]
MAQWHLNDLRNSLIQKGWDIVAELPGDDYAISGSWQIQRGDKAFIIDFNGLNPDYLDAAISEYEKEGK